MILDINIKELKDYTEKLRNLHKSALPVAVKMTLNDLAFNMRTELPAATKKKGMSQRQRRNIYTHLSRVEKADGWEISKMSASTGIYERSNFNTIAKGLAVQETGGVIPRKSKKIPYDSSRSGKTRDRAITRRYRARNIEIKQQHVKKGDFRKLFKVAWDAMKSPDSERYMVYDEKIWHIKTVKRIKAAKGKTGRSRAKTKRNTWIKGTPIYKYDPSHTPRLKPRSVLMEAERRAYKDVINIFVTHAQKRFDKYLK